MEIEQTLQIPSFTLYPVTTEDLKTCYESASHKILCALNGPYFDRRISQLQPHFNIQITQAQFNSRSVLSGEQLVRLERKVQEVLVAMVVGGKYQRMVFDVNVEIAQFNPHNPSVFLLAPVLNLISYTAMLKCLEISSAFSCSAALRSSAEASFSTSIPSLWRASARSSSALPSISAKGFSNSR